MIENMIQIKLKTNLRIKILEICIKIISKKFLIVKINSSKIKLLIKRKDFKKYINYLLILKQNIIKKEIPQVKKM